MTAIGFSSSFNTNYNPLTIQTSADVVKLMFVDLPHFLPALKFQSLTGMIDVKCMIVILISACVYDNVLRGGGGEPESIFRNPSSFLCLILGECCVALIELSIGLFVNALSLKLQPFWWHPWL